MLRIVVPGGELFDEERQKFLVVKAQAVDLEHSLISISKWESKWEKAFLSKARKTEEETRDYFRCMTITPNVNPDVYLCMTEKNIQEIQAYIDAPMSATRFRGETPAKGKSKTITLRTSEQIYAAMVKFGIPFECAKWHLNRLLILIHECEIINSDEKMSRKDSAKLMSQMNAARRAKHHTRG